MNDVAEIPVKEADTVFEDQELSPQFYAPQVSTVTSILLPMLLP